VLLLLLCSALLCQKLHVTMQSVGLAERPEEEGPSRRTPGQGPDVELYQEGLGAGSQRPPGPPHRVTQLETLDLEEGFNSAKENTVASTATVPPYHYKFISENKT